MRALRRVAVFRSCPPGRAAPDPPPLLHSTQRPAAALVAPAQALGTSSFCKAGCLLPRALGDRRSEVKEELSAARPTAEDMNGAGRPTPSAATRRHGEFDTFECGSVGVRQRPGRRDRGYFSTKARSIT